MIEEGSFTVNVTLTNIIDFSPIERKTALSCADAIDNARGTVRDEVWTQLEDEGWNIAFHAERIA